MVTTLTNRAPRIGQPSAPSAFDVQELRELARDDALLAHRTTLDRAALFVWLAMLVLVSGFLAAVGVTAALDAAGMAF